MLHVRMGACMHACVNFNELSELKQMDTRVKVQRSVQCPVLANMCVCMGIVGARVAPVCTYLCKHTTPKPDNAAYTISMPTLEKYRISKVAAMSAMSFSFCPTVLPPTWSAPAWMSMP